MLLHSIIIQLLDTPFKTNNFTVTAQQTNKVFEGYVVNYEYKNELLFQLEFVSCSPQIRDNEKIIELSIKKIYMKRASVMKSDFSDISFPENLPFRDAFIHLKQKNLSSMSQKDRDFSVYNYFCGPKIDDVRRGDSFTITTFGTEEIKDELDKLCKTLDVPVYFLPLVTKAKVNAHVEIEEWQWFRDMFRRLGNGSLMFNEKGLSSHFLNIVDSAIALNPRSGKNAFAKMLHKTNENPDESASDDEDGEAMVFGFETQGSYGSQLSDSIDPHKIELKELFQKAKIDIKSSKTLLEGGNTYCLTNTEGELFVVLGENSLVLTAAYRKQHNYQNLKLIAQLKNYPTPDNEFYLNLKKENNPIQWYDIEEAKLAIAEETNIHPSQLLILPNPLFHIDMIMTQGPDGTILLNDFQLVADVLEPIQQKLEDQLKQDPKNSTLRKKIAYLDSVLYQNHKLQQILGSFTSLLIKTFESNRFKVVSIPALAYQYLTNDKLFKKNEIDEDPRIVLNLVNGITGQYNSGNFLIALSPANENLMPLVTATEMIFKKHGITLHLVGSAAAAGLILNGHGSLRCMSFPNGAPGGDLNELIKLLPPPTESSEAVTRMRRRQNGFSRLRRLDQSPFNLSYIDELFEKIIDMVGRKEAEQSYRDALSLFGEQYLYLRACNTELETGTTSVEQKNTEEESADPVTPKSKSQCRYTFNGTFFVLNDKKDDTNVNAPCESIHPK